MDSIFVSDKLMPGVALIASSLLVLLWGLRHIYIKRDLNYNEKPAEAFIVYAGTVLSALVIVWAIVGFIVIGLTKAFS